MHRPRSRQPIAVPVLLALVASLCIGTRANGAEVHGQVTDATTGMGLDAARIDYDLVPPDGSSEVSQVSDPFGFYSVTNVAAGTYQVTYTRGGYYPVVETNVYSAADEMAVTTPLTPLPGGPGYEILVQVQCVTTAEKLKGVPVAAIRYSSPGDTVPAAPPTKVVTDDDGFARFSGMPYGHYAFQANNSSNGTPRAKWKDYSTLEDPKWPDKTLIDRSYCANFLLKPHPLQDISVRVVGHDPVTDSVRPLPMMWVELTGRSLRDGAVLVPPRTGVTDHDGIVSFTRLPAIAWTANAKRPGYTNTGVTVLPDPVTGDFRAGPIDLPVILNPTRLDVALKSPYAPGMMAGLHVELKGHQGSFTEGITRLAPAAVDPADGEVKVSFAGILPGRYTLGLNEPKASPPITAMKFAPHAFHVHFRGSGYGLAIDGATNTVELALAPVPARVQLRLYAADERGALEPRSPGTSKDRPIYRLRAQGGIEFRETAASGGLISTNDNTVIVDTDALGGASFNILPGVYGVKIPDMTNYWGSEALYELVGGTNTIDVGWPYGDAWPYGGSYNEPHQGAGLVFDSGGSHRIDLFVRRKKVDLEGVVFLDADDPATYQIIANPAEGDEVTLFYADMAETGGTVTMTGGTSGPVVTNMVAEPNGNFVSFTFPDVRPGSYTFAAAHPRNTFTGSGITIGEWGDFPGDTPPTPPGTPIDRVPLTKIEADSTPFGPLGFPPLLATYGGSDTITMNVYAWNENANPAPAYEFQFSVMDPSVVQPAYASNLYFSPIAPNHVVPVGGYEFWRGFGEQGWFTASGGASPYDVYLDGPPGAGNKDNTAASNAPAITYSLTIEDRSLDDPTLVIEPTTNFMAMGEKIEGGQTTNGFSGGFTPASVEHRQWEWPGDKPRRVEVVSRNPPHVLVTPLLKLGLAVSGTVSRVSTTQKVAQASVRVMDRYGNTLRKAVTATNGTYSFASALPAAQTLFVDVNAAGYQPWRERFGDTNILAAGSNLVVNPELIPLPPPALTGTTFDRYGLFLPGVTRSGDQNLLEGYSAAPVLKTTWSLRGDPAVYTNVMPAFDAKNGDPAGVVTNVLADEVREVFMIDPRSFPEGIHNVPIETNVPPDGAAGNGALLDWLATVESGAFPNMFHRKVANFPVDGGGVAHPSGSFQISSLPADAFHPVFAAVTERGVAAVDTGFEFADDTHQIRGIRMPPWLATSLNLMAAVAGAQKDAQYLKDVVPTERFGMLPTFTSTITTNADGFIIYTNRVSIDWKEGMKTPTGGQLSLGPGVLGLSFKGELGFGVDGSKALSVLHVQAVADTDELNRDDMLPAGAAEYLKATGTDLKVIKFRAVGSTMSSRAFDPARAPFEHRVIHTVGGGLLCKVTQNMTPLLQTLPYVGPLLKTADKSGALTISGLLTGGVGLMSDMKWETPFPPNVYPGGTGEPDPEPQVMRRHFLGGNKEDASKLAICFRFGIGASADSKKLRSGLSAELFIEGNNCTNKSPHAVQLVGAPSCRVTPNRNFDWPLVKRIQGQATVELNGYADVWLTKLEKQWRWRALTFDRSFGTDPYFELIPLEITTTMTAPHTATGATFVGVQPTMVRDFFEVGQHAAPPGPEALFVYTDIAPSGDMTIEASLPTGPGTWRAPVSVTSAGGVLALDAAEFPTGGWVVVWCEIDRADVGKPFPDSRLMFALSDATATTWTPPVLLETLTGSVASDIKLVDAGSFYGLLYLVTDGGPAGTSADLFGRTWSGEGWSSAVSAGSRTGVTEWDAAVFASTHDDKVMVFEAYHLAGLSTSVWDGASFTPSAPAVTNPISAFGVASVPDGSITLVTASREQSGFDVYLYGEVPGLVRVGEVETDGPPQNLAVQPLPTVSSNLVAWSLGGDPSTLSYAFIDAAANYTTMPVSYRMRRIDSIRLVPRSASYATLFARLAGDVNELRAFDVGVGGSETDSDNDGLADAEELQIADADPDDAIFGIADVLPDDDFDNDGMTNGDELRLGYDPTNADSAPRLWMSDIDGAGGFELFFETMAGHRLTPQKNTNLLNGTGWTDLAPVSGDGFPVAVPEMASQRGMFYRLKVEKE